MKRRKDVFEKIINRGNLLTAHKKASRGKSHYSSVEEVNNDLERKLTELQTLLKTNYTLEIEDYSHEVINDKGKERDLYKLPYFPHRVVQWAIMNVVMGEFMRNFTTDTYASIKGRGIHLVLKRVKKALAEDSVGTKYCLKLDIKKFYPNINNSILFWKLARKFKDKKFLALMKTIVFSMGDKGIPIGSLLSQYLANFYLSSFDHYCKEVLKLKYYYRYMDDITILHQDKSYLHKLKIDFDRVFAEEYDLKIKENWQVFPVASRGIDFVGYRFFHGKTILRKRIYIRARYVFSRSYAHKSRSSYYGWSKHADVSAFMKKHNIIDKRRDYELYN
ncbi:MAG: RNA-directed DNA polymerase [Fusobacteriaceae bacterium]